MVFCYFPISFRPPPNDPYGITADDLKLSLRKCMAATPHFAKMAIPLFLEKFPTSAGPAMKDLMISMGECFPTYGAAAVGERGKELYECAKTEVIHIVCCHIPLTPLDTVLLGHDDRIICPGCSGITHTDAISHAAGRTDGIGSDGHQGMS